MIRSILLAALLALPGSAFAAHGDMISNTSRSTMWYLCDTLTASADCPTSGVRVAKPGRAYSFYVDSETGCTGYSITLQDKATDGSTVWHDLDTLSYNIQTSITYEVPLGEYVRASVTNVTGCSDLDIVIEVIK